MYIPSFNFHTLPEAGKLLIASPFLADPHFSRSVVLLCDHSDEGSMGFVLNKISDYTLAYLFNDDNLPEIPVYLGGPVQKDTLHILHNQGQILGGHSVNNQIHWGGSFEALSEGLLDNTLTKEQLILTIGYAGWSGGQLEAECKEGSWKVIDALPGILNTNPKDLWKKCIRSLGPEYSVMLNMPQNPQYN